MCEVLCGNICNQLIYYMFQGGSPEIEFDNWRPFLVPDAWMYCNAHLRKHPGRQEILGGILEVSNV